MEETDLAARCGRRGGDMRYSSLRDTGGAATRYARRGKTAVLDKKNAVSFR
jgi:hypothetical protein